MAKAAAQAQRQTQIQHFLDQAKCGCAQRHPIPGDASFRRYERVSLSDAPSAILMDAPPEVEDVRPFLAVQSYYEAAGYAVPRILAKDEEQGFLLLNDLGCDSFSSVLREAPEKEERLYHAAIDVLASIARDGVDSCRRHALSVPSYDASLLTKEISLLGEWFLPLILGEERAAIAWADFQVVWKEILSRVELREEVIVHRDFHADNLFWLEKEPGILRVGMIDFQDAVLGMPAYDMVSLLEDARRDVSPEIVRSSLARFIEGTSVDEAQFMQEYAFFGFQRNAKILGIFTRLYQRDGKPRYLELIPRVWQNFLGDLQHPLLAPMKNWKEQYLGQEAEAKILNLGEAG